MISLTSALVIMLGADVGSSLMAVVFSLDLSWLSPLCIFTGVVLFVARQDTTAGRVGRILIGTGADAAGPAPDYRGHPCPTQSETVRTLLLAVTSDITLEIITGAVLAVISYSSLATVLLVSALAGSGGIPGDVALGLVLGVQLGSGMLALLTTLKSSVQVRQVPLGNLLFKVVGVVAMVGLIQPWLTYIAPLVPNIGAQVVLFHLRSTWWWRCCVCNLPGTLPASKNPAARGGRPFSTRPHHLDTSALATPPWPFLVRPVRPCTRPTSSKPCSWA